jgi:hypothetical protein
MQRQAFYPGKTWLDTAGKRIQAHGGALWYENGSNYQVMMPVSLYLKQMHLPDHII